ncbi:MAG: ATP-binding protein [Chloroflexota bacterium]|nr:ATP-binding protein [Chloroflexota bacterium]MDQ5865420.1 ATP-binding protein [Chloroflexota bacterium]
MLLTAAEVRQFKSIEDSGPVEIDPNVTVLVGQNESGKTAFLQALHKSRPVDKTEFNLVEDFPRKRLNAYVREHEANPAVVTELTYTLEPDEIEQINQSLGFDLLDELSFVRQHRYDGTSSVTLQVPEEGYIQHKVRQANLRDDLGNRLAEAGSIRQLISMLDASAIDTDSKALLRDLKDTFAKVPESWPSMLNYLLWARAIGPRIPRFLYFDDYYLLPGKINLPTLQQHVERQSVAEEDRTVLSLLRMAEVDLTQLTIANGYESVKAKLEAISNSITDKVFEYWKQNQELEVEFDIREDPHDAPPFNQGNNLYIRIRDRRHRVSVPFSQRSRGFVWFFSFIVWFDSIKQHLGTNADLILLLDEPGLNLHALAQADFLRYIEDLARDHQIMYTTHSPFMVPTKRLYQVRTVEARTEGSVISNKVGESQNKTLYPLQVALGYRLTENLFTANRNLLVESPADMLYLKYFSALLDKQRRTALRGDVTVVPMGGLGRLSTFMALLDAGEAELAVLSSNTDHVSANANGNGDTTGGDHSMSDTLTERRVLSYAMFRPEEKASGKSGGSKGSNASNGSSSGNGTGTLTASAVDSTASIEDLLSPGLYLKLFNAAYKEELGGQTVDERDLPPGDGIRSRLSQYVLEKGLQLSQSGIYDPYVVASHLVSNPLPPSKIDAGTLNRFEQLFQAVNDLYSTPTAR